MIITRGASIFYRESKEQWVLAYADPVMGQRQKLIPKTIKSERDATTWARSFLSEKKIDPSKTIEQRRDLGPAIGACVEKWLKLQTDDERVQPATLAGYKTAFNKYILPWVGPSGAPLRDVALAALDVPTVRAFVRDLRSKIGARTCRNYVYSFSAFYQGAMAEGWIQRESNLFGHPGVTAELPEPEGTETKQLPLDRVQALLDARATIPLERRARYILGATSAMRDGEIAGIQVKRLHLDASIPTVEVKIAVALIGAKGKGAFARPKDRLKTKSSRRTLPLHPAAVVALREWLTSAEWVALAGHAPGPDDYVFPGLGGKPARPRSAELLRDDLAAVGLPREVEGTPAEFKMLRATSSTALEEAGVNEGTRKKLMGHAAKDVTERHYTVRELESLARAVTVVPLTWTVAPAQRVIRPTVMTQGTSGEAKDRESLAPPAGVGPATFGLGKQRKRRPRHARSGRSGDAGALGGTPRIGVSGPIGASEDGLGCAGHVPGEVAEAAAGLAALRVVEAGYDAFLAAGDDEVEGRTSARGGRS